MNDELEIVGIYIDKPMYCVYLLFKHMGDQLEHPQNLIYSSRTGLFRLDSDYMWEKYDYDGHDGVGVVDFYKKHPGITQSDVVSFLAGWVNDNQEIILAAVLEQMPEFVDHGTEKAYFAQHCGYTYYGADLVRLFSNEVDRKHFEKAYKLTHFDGEEFSDFDRTIKIIEDQGIFVGTSAPTEAFELEFNGFSQIHPNSVGKPFAISFQTEPYNLD